MNREQLESILLQNNTQRMPFGISLTPDIYEKYLLGNEQLLSGSHLLNDFIAVERDVVDFYFIHYSIFKFSEVRPSTREGTSMGPGVYCYDASVHAVKTSTPYTTYKGLFTGKVIECIYDPDPCPGKPKDDGGTKEYLLLTDKPIPVVPLKNFYE